MGDDSWIKIYRSLANSPIMTHPGMLQIWMRCLIDANFKDSKWLIPGTLKEIPVPRGSLVTGRETLYSKLYPCPTENSPSSRTVWRWVQSLEKMGCLRVQNMSNRCSLISIVNYDTYQKSNSDNVQRMSNECPADVPPVSNRCPTGVQPVSTLKERKKERTDEGNNETMDTRDSSLEDSPNLEEDLQELTEGDVTTFGPSDACRQWMNIYPEHRRSNPKKCALEFESTLSEIQKSHSCKRQDALAKLVAITNIFSASWKGKHPDFCWSAENFLAIHWKMDPKHWNEPDDKANVKSEYQSVADEVVRRYALKAGATNGTL